LLNGFLIARIKLPALVATLGTYAFFRGIAYVLLGDQAGVGYPASFTYLGQGMVPHTLIPFSVALFAILAVVFGLVLHRTTFGRYLFAIGNNENAAIFAGVPVVRNKMIIYTISGFMAALAGLVLAARFGSTRPDIGTGMELSVITAAVLGGVDINGGVGTMPGAVLSLMLIGLMQFGMGLKNIQDQVQTIAIGGLLILSILLASIARAISAGGMKLNWRNVGLAAGIIIIFAVFFVFFYWSRAPVLKSVSF
jgi:rhamnose transport system permease protein